MLTSTGNTPAQGEKKKVRRVVKKMMRVKRQASSIPTTPDKPGISIRVGDKLKPDQVDDLQVVAYYMYDFDNKRVTGLAEEAKSSISNNVVTGEHVAAILDVVERERMASARTASVILGMEDGDVVEGSELVCYIRELIS
jgi:hypothetical protein